MRRALFLTVALTAACHGGGSIAPTPGRSYSAKAVRALRASIDSIVNAAEFRNAHWGVLVVTPTGDTLYSRNASKLFMPASNMKLLTSSVALAQLGPDFRYRTPVVAKGPLVDGTVNGDLAVFGRGDPSVSDDMRQDAMQPLRSLADAVYARGVRRISGRVIADGNAFSDAVLGFGWSWDDLESGYSAATDELLFNVGLSTVTTRAGAAPGDPVTVTTRPARTFPAVRVTATTVARPVDSTQRRPSLRVVKDTVTGEIVVSGTIIAGTSVVDTVTHHDPSAAFIAAFTEALRDRGVAIEGQTPPSEAPAVADTLAVMESPTLREILPALMKPSQNQIAEMLLETLGLEKGRAGTSLEGRRVVEAQLTAWGAIDGGFVVRDGSGLSRYDYISPETVIRVLDAMRRSPHFADFYASLPIAGVDGTIRSRMRGTPAENNVRAKTGSVAQARSLSGYVTAADGTMLMFSTLANNWTVPAANVTRAADSIAVRLARFRGR